MKITELSTTIDKLTSDLDTQKSSLEESTSKLGDQQGQITTLKEKLEEREKSMVVLEKEKAELNTEWQAQLHEKQLALNSLNVEKEKVLHVWTWMVSLDNDFQQICEFYILIWHFTHAT